MMSIHMAIFVSVLLMSMISVIIFLIGKRVSGGLIKYIPAIATGIGMLFFYIKMNYIGYQTHAFESIHDIIAIILLSVIFAVSLIGALLIEFTHKPKNTRSD